MGALVGFDPISSPCMVYRPVGWPNIPRKRVAYERSHPSSRMELKSASQVGSSGCVELSYHWHSLFGGRC